MRAQEGRRPLTGTWLGARRASSHARRALASGMWLAWCAACAPPASGDSLAASETVIGRARWRGNVVLLTDAPALITVDVERVVMTRQPIAGGRMPVSRLWGLAEHEGRLFTISAFDRLVQIDASPMFVEVGKLKRAVLNLVDLPSGMAVQLAGQSAGSPLLVAIDTSGAMAPLSTPLRSALGLTPPEEGLLHLLSCSVPPESICWLPGDVRVFAADGGGLRHLTSLAGLTAPAPAALIAAPERRVIEDAVSQGARGIIVLRNVSGERAQRLTRYANDGSPTADIVPPDPLRLLVSVSSRGVIAVTRAGSLSIVEM